MSRETSLGKVTTKQMCAAFSISRQAFSAARRAPERETEPNLAGEPKPASCRKLRGVPTEVVKEAIKEVVEENPGWGVRKVWATLRRTERRASYKRIYALMKVMGLTFEGGTHRTKDTSGHVAVPESNRRWATDMTTVWTRKDGNVALVPVIDCGDRFVFEIGVSKSQDSRALLRPVEQALMAQFGCQGDLPCGFEMRTDHGPQYTGEDCALFCKGWKIEHTFAPVGRPTGNAVAERFIQTLKVELIWLRDWDSLEEVQEAVQTWLRIYNTRRPHQSLGWLTPAEKRALNLPKVPNVALAEAA
jgi:putative transposase